MSGPIAFNAYLGWVDATDPTNIPADVRIISSADLLRYENFGKSAAAKINENADAIAQNATTLGNQGQSLASLAGTVTTQGQTIASQGQAIAAANTAIATANGNIATANGNIATAQADIAALKALTGPAVRTSKTYDLTVAGGARNVAAVTGGTNFTSFEVGVTVIGRNSSGTLYLKAVRYVRPENGNPQYVTVGTDTVAGGIAVSFTTNGVSGVNVVLTASVADPFVTVHVEAKAGGGASSAAARTVTVAMA